MELAYLPFTWDLQIFQYSSAEGGKPSLSPQPIGWKNNVLLLYRRDLSQGLRVFKQWDCSLMGLPSIEISSIFTWI